MLTPQLAQWLAEALEARGRVWGDRNGEQRRACSRTDATWREWSGGPGYDVDGWHWLGNGARMRCIPPAP